MWLPPLPLPCLPWKAPAATSSCTDFNCHGASPAQVRGKTESSRRPLSFPPNSKTSCALNHQQSNLQEAPVCQPCPPAMEVSRGIILVGPQLLIFFGVKIGNYWRRTLFCLLIPIWGVANNKFWGENISNTW